MTDIKEWTEVAVHTSRIVGYTANLGNTITVTATNISGGAELAEACYAAVSVPLRCVDCGTYDRVVCPCVTASLFAATEAEIRRAGSAEAEARTGGKAQ